MIPKFLDTTFKVPYQLKPRSWTPFGPIIVNTVPMELFSNTIPKFVPMAQCKNNFATTGIPMLQFVNGAQSNSFLASLPC
jgi:hypothetical protein